MVKPILRARVWFRFWLFFIDYWKYRNKLIAVFLVVLFVSRFAEKILLETETKNNFIDQNSKKKIETNCPNCVNKGNTERKPRIKIWYHESAALYNNHIYIWIKMTVSFTSAFLFITSAHMCQSCTGIRYTNHNTRVKLRDFIVLTNLQLVVKYLNISPLLFLYRTVYKHYRLIPVFKPHLSRPKPLPSKTWHVLICQI